MCDVAVAAAKDVYHWGASSSNALVEECVVSVWDISKHQYSEFYCFLLPSCFKLKD